MNPVQIIEAYFSSLRDIYSTGGSSPETSFYSSLETLLNAVGGTLKPAVRCVSQLRNVGSGSPDFGLYTSNQFQRTRDDEPIPGQLPARGVVEVKPWRDDAFVTAGGDQVSKYWNRYQLVMATNYRDFVIVAEDGGKPVRRETFRLAESVEVFREMLDHPRKAAEVAGERFTDFLKRSLMQNAPIGDPADVAWFLASYAREARGRIKDRKQAQGLELLKKSLEEALGLKFESEKGEHFFHATLVQTLFYGVFSAWVLWARQKNNQSGKEFDWRLTGHLLHVPMIKSLFHQIGEPSRLKELQIDEVLHWTGSVLNRIDQTSFFDKFVEDHAVQYFYEPFLKAYDPELRKELGVWYTPPEIVKYQVARVDTVLREELGIHDGLADPQVIILDPCCGTGAYLVEVLQKIYETEKEKWGDDLVASRVHEAAKQRVFGFELLPAPFVISHLQVGLFLNQINAPLSEESERVGVFLTNALTGWEPPKEPKLELPFPEFQRERELAGNVKQGKEILVILGNPPYNGYAGLAMEEERDLTDAYRTTQRASAPQGQGLNDLYVRFFRMAERRIVEKTGRGIVCFISNYSWLEGLSYTGMRESYLDRFDKIWIDNLHGDRKISEYAPDGKTSQTVFAMGAQSLGIKVGTSITLLALKGSHRKKPGVFYRDFDQARAKDRRAALLESVIQIEKPGRTAAKRKKSEKYIRLEPPLSLGYPFKPSSVQAEYLEWPLLPDIFPVSFPGVKTSRDDFLVSIDRERLESRIRDYFNSAISDDDLARRYPSIMADTPRFSARAVRRNLLGRGVLTQNIVRYAYRPFDLRWLYWDPETKLLDEKRENYFHQIVAGNSFLVSQQKPRREWSKPQFACRIGCLDLFDRGASCFPIKLVPNGLEIFESTGPRGINISQIMGKYLKILRTTAKDVLDHVFAVLHSGDYADSNASALRQNWPRAPLPQNRSIFLNSARLGARVADLLDPEKPVDGVTRGKIDPRLRMLGQLRSVHGEQLRPDRGDLDLTAGWGHGGQGGVVMPARGKVVHRKIAEKMYIDAFGDETMDVYLNENALWSNVPPAVWNYSLGGYQVLKKWLSYREKSVLGRALTLEEAQYVTEMIRRIAALILLQPELDANYQAVKADTWPWPSESDESSSIDPASTGPRPSNSKEKDSKKRNAAAETEGELLAAPGLFDGELK